MFKLLPYIALLAGCLDATDPSYTVAWHSTERSTTIAETEVGVRFDLDVWLPGYEGTGVREMSIGQDPTVCAHLERKFIEVVEQFGHPKEVANYEPMGPEQCKEVDLGAADPRVDFELVLTK